MNTADVSPRNGAVILEFILALPIIFTLFVATLQFGSLLLLQQAVSHAAIEGAREAGKGASLSEIVQTVEEVLAPHKFTIGPNASVILEDPDSIPPVQEQGTLMCNQPATPTLGAGEVRVTVCVDITVQPLGNALRTLGVDLSGRRFERSSVAKKE